MDGGEESLLGKEDALALGIIHLDKIGTNNKAGAKVPERVRVEKLGRITPQIKEEPIKEGVVSGGQTQEEIDADMEKLVEEFQHMFEGMGQAKVDPIDKDEAGSSPGHTGTPKDTHPIREATGEEDT